MEEEDPVVHEYELIYKEPAEKLHLLQFMTKPLGNARRMEEIEHIDKVELRPTQNLLQMSVSVKGLGSSDQHYTYTSRTVNNKSYLCVGHVQGDQVVLLPVADTYQMRRTFEKEDKTGAAAVESKKSTKKAGKTPAKIKDGDDEEDKEGGYQPTMKLSLKSLEWTLRSYPAQKEVLNAEPSRQLTYLNAYSRDTSQLLAALLDIPKTLKQVPFLDKYKYADLLF
jgi:hypothetical protein